MRGSLGALLIGGRPTQVLPGRISRRDSSETLPRVQDTQLVVGQIMQVLGFELLANVMFDSSDALRVLLSNDHMPNLVAYRIFVIKFVGIILFAPPAPLEKLSQQMIVGLLVRE